ncbi:MAG: glycoside hydrolase family 95 protein, partial [Victivallales bacterium]|nr:glycoside hydrolase family 95 protein [Victivallales bacterium]
GQDPASTCADRLRTASARPFADLLARHVEDYQRLFRRVSFELGTPAPAALPTDELLARAEEGECTSALLSLYFQFGRYLLISSSRPGGLPANLQGIWADGFDPPWNADYHTNINLQMNYWPAEVCALTECHEPLFTFVDALRPRGRETARDVFDCRGFVVGHTTDVWLHGSIIGKPAYGMWPYGAAWCACHFWE